MNPKGTMSGGGRHQMRGRMLIATAGSRKSVELSERDFVQLGKEVDEV